MIKAKTHKAKSDKETIIDMEPVNETQKTIILKNPIFLIPFITVFSFIIILIFLLLFNKFFSSSTLLFLAAIHKP